MSPPPLTGSTVDTNDTIGSQLATVIYFLDLERKMIYFSRAFTVRCVKLAKLVNLTHPVHVTASNSVVIQ